MTKGAFSGLNPVLVREQFDAAAMAGATNNRSSSRRYISKYYATGWNPVVDVQFHCLWKIGAGLELQVGIVVFARAAVTTSAPRPALRRVRDMKVVDSRNMLVGRGNLGVWGTSG